VSDELDVCSTATGPAELPQLAGRPVIVVDRLVDGVGVDLAGAVAVERGRNVFDELTQSRLMIGGYAFARGSAFGLRSPQRDDTATSCRLLPLTLLEAP
jgi:hypothetical protein